MQYRRTALSILVVLLLSACFVNVLAGSRTQDEDMGGFLVQNETLSLIPDSTIDGLTLSTNYLFFPYRKTAKLVQISSKLRSPINYMVSSNRSWVSLTPSQGSTPDTICITVSANYSSFAREATCTVYGNIAQDTLSVFSGVSMIAPERITIYQTGKSKYVYPIPSPPPITSIAMNEDQKIAGVPETYRLEQNYPNPFNLTTVIKFSTPEQNDVSIDIFDIRGRHIMSLWNGFLKAGYHSIAWHGNDDKGHIVPSGTYLYVLKTGDYRAVKKMTLLK